MGSLPAFFCISLLYCASVCRYLLALLYSVIPLRYSMPLLYCAVLSRYSVQLFTCCSIVATGLRKSVAPPRSVISSPYRRRGYCAGLRIGIHSPARRMIRQCAASVSLSGVKRRPSMKVITSPRRRPAAVAGVGPAVPMIWPASLTSAPRQRRKAASAASNMPPARRAGAPEGPCLWSIFNFSQPPFISWPPEERQPIRQTTKRPAGTAAAARHGPC